MTTSLFLGRGSQSVELPLSVANRHGLIAGATGTGKTVTLKVLAEGFSNAGVPVLIPDVKGDISGIAFPGTPSDKLSSRLQSLQISDHQFKGFPVELWDPFGERGHPLRTTISEMGPILLSRLLNLNDTQAGVLQLVFRIADDHELLLIDLKDLRAVLKFVGDNGRDFTTEYGNVSPASVGAIQRGLLALEEQGGDKIFGEPALSINDFMQTAPDGRGVIQMICASKLMQSPKVYSTLLLWMLTELFEQCPEVGDPEKPKLVFFFDEAHLLFDEAPAALLEKIEQLVRLIRSKGIGVYFVTQSPMDVPERILAQLGNRVQHALRAFTPRDQKAVNVIADTFRPNPAIDIRRAITELAVGEALVSCLDPRGTPHIVDRALIAPPQSRFGPATDDELLRILKSSSFYGYYEREVDRESAYEMLKKRAAQAEVSEDTHPTSPSHQPHPNPAAPRKPTSPRTSQRQGIIEAFIKSGVRSVGSNLGRQIARGILGSLLGGRR